MPSRGFLDGRYAERFKAVFGQNIFAARTNAFTLAMCTIGRLEREDPGCRPYTSKFDCYLDDLDGKLQLTAQDLRDKSNC